jgi:hypothetical protein
MNRRNFITRGLAALAGLLIGRKALAESQPKTTGISTGLGYNFYDLQSVRPSLGPRRRVLAMSKWWEIFDGEPGSALYYREPVSRKPWPHPRYAGEWHEIEFEELKQGDHFRLIDECPDPVEDGNPTGEVFGKNTVPRAFPYRFN